MDKINWQTTEAAIWLGGDRGFKIARRLDPILLDNLLNIEAQKTALLTNTDAFLSGKASNHALLWGQRGCGKSSLIKAVFNALKGRGLRLVEVDRDRLAELPLIADLIEGEPFRFVIFCDDLSFEANESGYKGLKRVLEGSIELPPENLRLYATSNRRHLVSESASDNDGAIVAGERGELHYADIVEEKLSLSDRFGLVLSFYGGDLEGFLRAAEAHFAERIAALSGDDREKFVELLRVEAKRYTALRASRSGRTAKQFAAYFETFF
ncbi:MAG: ATP-binding protein [Helicobacteraceae bacterium]|jgi:predicted AAA+ superfamily ATPase|nr:ATP-binding protein [Helicobacteraceae bacterium]